MYEVDFHAIEKTGESGSKSGDAISMHFTESVTGRSRIVVIDGGFGHTGEQLVEHMTKFYGGQHVDVVISTHPDQDHINGLGTVLDEFSVGELMIHRPHDHTTRDVGDFGNIEVVDALIGLAEDKGVTVTEPFAGLTRFGGQLRILGPTLDRYESMVEQHLTEVESGMAAARIQKASLSASLASKAFDLLDRAAAYLPVETLQEGGETSPRNNMSVVTLVTSDADDRMMFTGDVGIEALNESLDEYEGQVASLPDRSMGMFQAPHHGSKRNLAPSVLNRMFGTRDDGAKRHALISSAKTDKKHPSPKVTNALIRRGLETVATEGRTICHWSADVRREGWGPVDPIGPLDEDEDD